MIAKGRLDSQARFYYLMTLAAMGAEFTMIIGLFIVFFVLIIHIF